MEARESNSLEGSIGRSTCTLRLSALSVPMIVPRRVLKFKGKRAGEGIIGRDNRQGSETRVENMKLGNRLALEPDAARPD